MNRLFPQIGKFTYCMTDKIIPLLALILFVGCQSAGSQKATSTTERLPIDEKIFVELGGEEQYVEITGASPEFPVLLFLHGGPGWPQTPHIRYFNADLVKELIVVSWDQSGCGQSYLKNPNPKELSVESLVRDAHELTQYLKKKV
ncbi:MAG: hypothetical protein AAF960_10015 [Bacteroidota bacterium]